MAADQVPANLVHRDVGIRRLTSPDGGASRRPRHLFHPPRGPSAARRAVRIDPWRPGPVFLVARIEGLGSFGLPFGTGDPLWIEALESQAG